ncbi:MAG: GNAT family N-acetyltransferase [Gammaproteobacteria bacterium]|jgi:predicted GNAT superfamily acetyltransferase
MTQLGFQIDQATEADLEGIMELQAANQAENGGSLSANLPRSRIVTMMNNTPLIVARRNTQVVAFLMTSTRTMNTDVPIIRAMLDAYPGTDDAYVYGPICVDAKERGKGLARAMFAKLRDMQPGREGILFVRRDNMASLRSHEKMGMHEVANFEFRGVNHAVLNYFG